MSKHQQIYFALVLVFYTTLALFTSAVLADNQASLQNIIDGKQRSEQSRARDSARHPLQTLKFFQLKPNATVIEIWPGKGWYTEILAPYIKQGGGQYIAAGFPIHSGPQWRRKMQQAFQDYLTMHPKYYDAVQFTAIGPPYAWTLGEDNSVDTVLTFRNVHNWVKGDYAKQIFQSMYKVLKPGGTLGIIDHRAKENTDIEIMNKSGYLTEKLVITLAQEAGFVLIDKSEINANPKDTKNHPEGVWTLPPTLRLGDKNKDQYLAIGESDRMTLKFRKP